MRLMVYDRTCVWTRGHLTPAWMAGSVLYRTLGRIDGVLGVADWDTALAWLASAKEPISEIQYWGHGRWGAAYVATDILDADSLAGRHRAPLEAVRERLAPDALVWFRTCETLGARRGHDFGMRLADFLGARVAGHTYIIHMFQSGLCGVAPGQRPHWPDDEGLLEGTPDAPQRARSSTPWAPRTITCFEGRVPPACFG